MIPYFDQFPSVWFSFFKLFWSFCLYLWGQTRYRNVMYLFWKLITKLILFILCHYCKKILWRQLQLELHVSFWEIIFLQKQQNRKNRSFLFLPISLLSDKVQSNLLISRHFTACSMSDWQTLKGSFVTFGSLLIQLPMFFRFSMKGHLIPR